MMQAQVFESYERSYERRATREHVKFPRAVEGLIEARTAEGVFVVDPDYRIVHWDARAESLTGLLAEEMVGEPCYEVFSGESKDGTAFYDHANSALRLARVGQPAPGYDVRVFTRSGRERWVGVSNLVVDTEKGPYLVNLMRDTQTAHETLARPAICVWLSRHGVPEESPVRSRPDTPVLTPRQLEVLGLLAAGKSAREICRELYLSQATVRNHIRALLVALGAHSQLEALARARAAGLLDR